MSVIKRAEDCDETDDLVGPLVKLINGCPPDEFGNISLTAEDLLLLRAGTPSAEGGPQSKGLIIETIMKQDEICPHPFEVASRGSDGAAGPDGPPGPAGFSVICDGDICCPCLSLAIPPPGGGGGQQPPQLAIPRIIDKEGCFNIGQTIQICGTGFRQPNPFGPGYISTVIAVILCKCPPGAGGIEVPITVLSDSKIEFQIPPGINVPPCPNNLYCLRLKTIPLPQGARTVGFTNLIYLCINP